VLFVFGSKLSYAKRKRNYFRFEAKQRGLSRLVCFKAKHWISYAKRKGRRETKRKETYGSEKRSEKKNTEAERSEKKNTEAKNKQKKYGSETKRKEKYRSEKKNTKVKRSEKKILGSETKRKN
jgi:stringent starvation protein B